MTLVAVGDADGRSAWTITDGIRSFAVFVVDGGVRVTDAGCPHRGGPLVEGVLRDGAVVCPWHWYTYELDGGRCRTTEQLSLTTYPVVDVDGSLMADVGEAPAVRSWAEILRAHAAGI